MSSSDNHTPLDEKKEIEGEFARETRGGGEAHRALPDEGAREGAPLDEADRVSLRRLNPVPSPIDLTRSVPDLIRRRSQGRFFGRKRLSDRLPFEWLSLGMLLLLAAIYAALKVLSPT